MLAAVGIVVWLIGLCYMTVAAAKRSEDKEVHLTNFDKIRTEIPIALLFVFSICLTALGMRVHSQSYGFFHICHICIIPKITQPEYTLVLFWSYLLL